ncbi:MAG: DUF2203 family protein [Planctomycetota bacterium]|jgi:hypothetical protein
MATIRKTLYDVDSANRILPLVSAIVRDVVKEFHTLRHAGRQQRILEAEAVVGGPSTRKIRSLKSQVQECSARIEGYLLELEELGIELRDLDSGLVDFPTIMRGEPAFLCWKPGEEDVQWWHTAGQGFADRRPIPTEERAVLPAHAR